MQTKNKQIGRRSIWQGDDVKYPNPATFICLITLEKFVTIVNKLIYKNFFFRSILNLS